jgi:hypothetical protein
MLDEQGSGSLIDPTHSFDVRSNLIGFGLVFGASLGICVSLNLQSLVHKRNMSDVTGQPKTSFFNLPLWWVGVILNAVSELVRRARAPTRPLPPATHFVDVVRSSTLRRSATRPRRWSRPSAA